MEIAVREGIHERIQAEIHHEDKEAKDAVEEMLEVPPEWNDVPDLMMEDKDVRPATKAAVKRKIDEEALGRRKQRKEDDIHPEKREHSPTVSRRTWNLEGFFSEDWNEAQQEEDEWQTPDKWQRISQMVFCGGCLEIILESADISQVPVLNTKEVDVAFLRSREKKPMCREGWFSNPTI